ncbi:MAG: metallophosphoesterase [Planctomycetia bacterium]|nr:metallophosphoesterase [Planctomycetia bacterium]
MKILCLADIHGSNTVFSELLNLEAVYDAVFIAGDILIPHQEKSLAPLLVKVQKHLQVPIYLTPGNHDYWKKSLWAPYKQISPLIDETVEIRNGWKVFFTPWSTPFGNWNWMRPDKHFQEDFIYTIPDDVKIIVSHGPAFGFIDLVRFQHVGSVDLLNTIKRLPHLQYVLTGHIHGWEYDSIKEGNILFQNISCVNEDYLYKGQFITLELPD